MHRYKYKRQIQTHTHTHLHAEGQGGWHTQHKQREYIQKSTLWIIKNAINNSKLKLETQIHNSQFKTHKFQHKLKDSNSISISI